MDERERSRYYQNWMDDIDDYYLKDIRHARQKFITVAYDNNFFADTIIDHNTNISQEDLTSKSKSRFIML